MFNNFYSTTYVLAEGNVLLGADPKVVIPWGKSSTMGDGWEEGVEGGAINKCSEA